MWEYILIGLIGLLAILRIMAWRDAHYFESRGVAYLGNGIYRMIVLNIKGLGMADSILIKYNKIEEKSLKIGGSNDFGALGVMVTDLDLLKGILVKDFDHFVDRRQFKSPGEKLLSKMLIASGGDQWKALRSKMSPTFTTGKIRRMFSIFDDSGKKLVKFVAQQMDKSPEGQMDLMEGYSKYTLDVIASAAFGIDSKSFEQEAHSIFEEMAKRLQFTAKMFLRLVFILLAPNITNKFGITLFEKEVELFFSKVIKDAIKHRQESGVKRNDFIQLMLEAREGKLKTEESELGEFEKGAVISSGKTAAASTTKGFNEADMLDDDGIVSNCVLFILGGFDTTQSLLSFAAYALALHPEIQERLRTEIESTLDQNDGEFTYESVNSMTYMDMVINESLRLYPPAGMTDRACTIDYKIPNTTFTLKKGQIVNIPIYGIHLDEKYYPNPERFDPERFSSENRPKLNQFAFMPFGQGPRNCIGMRFALMEVKLAIAHLVHNFNIEPSQKTLIPMKFQNNVSLKPKNGMWLALKKRDGVEY